VYVINLNVIRWFWNVICFINVCDENGMSWMKIGWNCLNKCVEIGMYNMFKGGIKWHNTQNQLKKYTILFSFKFIYITFSLNICGIIMMLDLNLILESLPKMSELKCRILSIVICSALWKVKRMKRRFNTDIFSKLTRVKLKFKQNKDTT